MRNPTYEQLLEKEGVKWSYAEKIALAEINETKSLRNQARLELPIDQDLVEGYAQALRKGMQFPPLVLWRQPHGKYVVIDGNQRMAAYGECKWKTVDAYIVDSTDSIIIDRLTWTWNNKVNGKRLSAEDCLEHALTFVRKYGYTQRQAAEEWGISAASVQNALAVEGVREALNRQKISVPASVSDGVLHDLQPLIRTGEDVLAGAASVVFGAALPRKETVELVDAVLKAKTHDDRIAAVQKMAQSERVERRRAETKNGRQPRLRESPSEQLARWLKQGARLVSQFPSLKPLLAGNGTEAYQDQRLDAKVINEALILAFGLGRIPREEAS